MKVNNRLFLLLLLSFGVLSCTERLEKDIPLVKLGTSEKEYTMEVSGGEINIPVYSNGKYHLEIVSGQNGWLKLTMPEVLTENGYIHAECDFNNSFRRKVVFALCSDVDDRKDTVVFRQKGTKQAVLAAEDRSPKVKGSGGEESFRIITNIPASQIEHAVTYSQSGSNTADWIKSVTISEGDPGSCEIRILSEANPDEEASRNAKIRLKFTDEWDETLTLDMNVIQLSAQEKLGRLISMNELRNGIAESGKAIESAVIIEGIVISNKAGRNAGENEQKTVSDIDDTVDQRTIYIESYDGELGLCLVTNTQEDNQSQLYDHVQVLLIDTVPVIYSDPDFIVIKNVTADKFVEQKSGKADDVPVKNRSIADLTDNDIFTYVTLQDVEIPVRKGDLMPVNEGYTIAGNSKRLAKYPRLIRDINGDDMYLYTNTTCKFRNDGTLLPQGSGKISGVIVHERFSRFEWEEGADPLDMDSTPNLGRIGTYQIRPQQKDDIWKAMKQDVEDGFSHILTEYRYWNPDPDRGVCLPTYGTNGWFTHTYQEKYTGSAEKQYTESDFNQHFSSGETYDYAGPKGKATNYFFGRHIGNENGLGIIIDPSRESWNPRMNDLVDQSDPSHPQWCGPEAISPYSHYDKNVYGSINYTSVANVGKGIVPRGCYTAFEARTWWDYERNKPYSWLLYFSTKDISGSNLSLQIAQLNTSQQFFTPRYWKLEWSTTDDQTDSNWTEIAEYTVPDIAVNSTPLFHSIAGYKQMNFRLPDAMLGRDHVYIRLSPRNDICSSGSGYADSRMSAAEKAEHTSAISYIAVRYN